MEKICRPEIHILKPGQIKPKIPGWPDTSRCSEKMYFLVIWVNWSFTVHVINDPSQNEWMWTCLQTLLCCDSGCCCRSVFAVFHWQVSWTVWPPTGLSHSHTHTDAKVKGPSLGHCVGVCALSPHCLLSILVFWMDVRRAAAAVTAILNSTDQNVSVAEYQKLSSTVLKASCLGFKSSCRPLLHIISCHFSTVNYQNNGNFVNNTFKKNCLFCRQKKHI